MFWANVTGYPFSYENFENIITTYKHQIQDASKLQIHVLFQINQVYLIKSNFTSLNYLKAFTVLF